MPRHRPGLSEQPPHSPRSRPGSVTSGPPPAARHRTPPTPPPDPPPPPAAGCDSGAAETAASQRASPRASGASRGRRRGHAGPLRDYRRDAFAGRRSEGSPRAPPRPAPPVPEHAGAPAQVPLNPLAQACSLARGAKPSGSPEKWGASNQLAGRRPEPREPFDGCPSGLGLQLFSPA